MTCNFTSFSTVFQSYQGDRHMKGFVQWNPVYDWKDLCLRRSFNVGPLVQQASPYPTELLRLQKLGEYH